MPLEPALLKIRFCPKCGVQLTRENAMPSHLRDGGQCRDCYNKFHIIPRKAAKSWRLTYNSKKNKWYLNKSKYGLDRPLAERLMGVQKSVCAICRKPLDLDSHNGFSPDHDHETSKMRGLLCIACNNGLGQFKDNIELLKRAIEYLGNPPIQNL